MMLGSETYCCHDEKRLGVLSNIWKGDPPRIKVAKTDHQRIVFVEEELRINDVSPVFPSVNAN